MPSSDSPCSHLLGYRSNAHGVAKPFRSLRPCLRSRGGAGSLSRAEIRRDAHEIPRCASCSSAAGDASIAAAAPRLYACLACASVLCPDHAPDHASAAAGHEIAVDVDRAELFCCACGDQIYDADFDSAVVLAVKTPAIPSAENENNVATRKRRRVDYRPWSPDLKEKEAIFNGSRLLMEDGSSNSSGIEDLMPRGLRGMNNLGNTCFMSSVLQALLHTPPLRNYFLSDLHNRFACQQKWRKKKVGNGGNGNVRVCLACDLDAIYSAVFSGDRAPYSPAKFLYSWWQHASNLASYEQQDAHEFFISMLDAIHEKVEGDQIRPPTQSNGECCIAHRVFSGILRSDVMCTACGFASTTYDPCVDISLDLDSIQNPPKVAARSKFHARNGNLDSNTSSQTCEMSTLMGCLERFTRPERLGSDQKFFCQNCQTRQDSLKQMSIRKLPLVICFHIKRFEHSPVKRMSQKIDRYLQFPLSLNMAPYLSSSILRTRYGNRIFSSDADDSDVASELASEFELFAMISHSGKLEAGHYITYLRLNNQWFKCDDAWIVHVTENTVRASQAYMLFYVQKTLYYKASENVVSSRSD